MLHRSKFALPLRLVTSEVVCCSLALRQRGEHEIEDELVFSNHTGYVFHDSRGIECGGTEELHTLQEFIQRKANGSRLQTRLHAIWFELLYIQVNDDE